MICASTLKLYLEIISSVISIVGIPIAIWIFYRNKWKEKSDREYQTYNALDDKYIDFLVLCVDNADLDVYNERKLILTPEQEHKRLVMYEILISIFERAFLMYKDHDSKIKREQWQGWLKYIIEWYEVESFKKAWMKLGDQWDSKFVDFMNKILLNNTDDDEPSTNNYVISYHTLRQLIGILGIVLPFLCWGVNGFINENNLLNSPIFVNTDFSSAYMAGANLKSSISHFYYTASGPLFTGILITLAIFLFCYQGHPKKKTKDKFAWLSDGLLSRFAATCALLIVVFPTGSDERITDNIHIFISSDTAGTLHLVFAALFFVTMSVFCIINFRRNDDKTLRKDAEGKIYLFCGLGIIIMLLVLLVNMLIRDADKPSTDNFVFWMESFMLFLFGIAWLVKGKAAITELVLKKL